MTAGSATRAASHSTTCTRPTGCASRSSAIRRRGFEPSPTTQAVAETAQGLREAGELDRGRVLRERERRAGLRALAPRARTGSARNTALLPDDLDPAVDAFRAPLSAIRDAEICLVLGDEPVVERAPVVDLWLRAARRAGAEVVTIGPSGSISAAPGSAAVVCHDLLRDDPPEDLREIADQPAQRLAPVAIVWSGDDHDRGRRAAGLAASLGLGEGSGALRPAAHPERPRRLGRLARGRRWPRRGAIRRGRDRRADHLRRRGSGRSARRRAGRARALRPRDDDVHRRPHALGARGRSRDELPRARRDDRQPRGPARSASAAPSTRRSRTSSSSSRAWARSLAFPIAPWAGGCRARGARRAAAARVARRRRPSLAPLAVAERRRAGPRAPRPTARSSAAAASSGSSRSQFQRPHAEVELQYGRRGAPGRRDRRHRHRGHERDEPRARGARINRRLRAGVVRIADEHAAGLDGRVEVDEAVILARRASPGGSR